MAYEDDLLAEWVEQQRRLYGNVVAVPSGWLNHERERMTTKYSVQVKSVEGWTHHSDHVSYRAAVDQADMVHGRVLCPTGETDENAWRYAALHQGFAGDFGAWQAMDDDERSEYESGAQGLPTA